MKRILTVAALLVVSVADLFAQRVDRVIDGGTIVVSTVGPVRLIGVDTPDTTNSPDTPDTTDTTDSRRPLQAFGVEASTFLRQLLGRQTVKLEFDQPRTDHYRRTLAYVYLPDGTFVNAEILKRGYGHAYVGSPFKYLAEFRRFEQHARIARLGLWRSGGPTNQAAPVVYVTPSGNRYHRRACKFVTLTAVAMPLGDVPANLDACQVCKPPRRPAIR